MEGEFLSRDEILDIFKTLNSKTAGDKNKAAALSQREPGQLIWIKNESYDEADQENKTRPFYMANVVADLGDKCTCKIADKEKCTEAKFLRPFDLDKSLIMDYSPMADKGL